MTIGLWQIGLVVIVVFLIGFFIGKGVGYKKGRNDFRGF